MVSIENTLQFMENNWVNIVFILVVLYIAIKRVISFIKMSKAEKIEIVLKLVKEELLALMTEAEIDWKEFEKAGEVKRSQVIAKIYDKFPILAKYINQEELISKIDKMIEEEKVKLDKIINKEENK